MRVIGYARVSTDEQANEGLSLEAQESKIREYCRLYDLELRPHHHRPGRIGQDTQPARDAGSPLGCGPGRGRGVAMDW